MKIYTAVVEKGTDTGLYIGYVPGSPKAHSQAETFNKLDKNLKKLIEMLLIDGNAKS